MSQTYDANNPLEGTTQWDNGDFYAVLRNHQEAMRSLFSGSSDFSAPVVGQLQFRTDEGDAGIVSYYTGLSSPDDWLDVSQATYLPEVLSSNGKTLSGTGPTTDTLEWRGSSDKSNYRFKNTTTGNVDLTIVGPDTDAKRAFSNGGLFFLIISPDSTNSVTVKKSSTTILPGDVDLVIPSTGGYVSMVGRDGKYYAIDSGEY